MKVYVGSGMGSSTTYLKNAIDHRLDQTDYYSGEIESLKDRVRNLMEMVASLVVELAEHKTVSKEYIESILPYDYRLSEDEE